MYSFTVSGLDFQVECAQKRVGYYDVKEQGHRWVTFANLPVSEWLEVLEVLESLGATFSDFYRHVVVYGHNPDEITEALLTFKRTILEHGGTYKRKTRQQQPERFKINTELPDCGTLVTVVNKWPTVDDESCDV